MSSNTQPRHPGRRFSIGRRTLLGLGLAAAALAACSTSAHPAFAKVSVCRSDPMFMLSNGYKLTVIDMIGTHVADVRSINYIIHIPAGTTITRAVYTGGAFLNKETSTVIADNPANTYDADSIVTTHSANVPVTEFAGIQSQLDTFTYRATGLASGFSGQDLHVHMVVS